MGDKTALAVIEEQADASIRRVWQGDRWYFSVIDVLGVLTDSPNPGVYWRVLKTRLKNEEGAAETVTNCNGLKMTARDGKQRMTDAADMETMLRIIQSVPSPKAEPVKRWLARVGAAQLHPETGLGSSVAISDLPRPAEAAPAMEWARYHERVAALYRRAAAIETTLADHDVQILALHDRMESAEAALSLLPEILERLGPQTLSPEHAATVKALVKQLHEVGGFSYATIYYDLAQSFHVGKVDQLLEEHWPTILEWFQVRLAAATKR